MLEGVRGGGEGVSGGRWLDDGRVGENVRGGRGGCEGRQ